MNKKDYLHLYLGCEVTDGFEITGTLTEVSIDTYGQSAIILMHGINYRLTMDAIKPILRPLSDIKKGDIDLGDFIPEYNIITRRFTGGYCIEFDSIHDDGYCLTIYPDGSLYCICKDNGENHPCKGGQIFKQLLKAGFDIFGLIEAELAINQTKFNR